MSATIAAKSTADDVQTLRPSRSLTLGFLAMTPLFCAYEWALASRENEVRNAAEWTMSRALRPFAEQETHARWALLAILVVIALAVAKARGAAISAGVARIVLEAGAAACVLGPLMVVGLWMISDPQPSARLGAELSAPGPELSDAAFAFGAGAWEELLFRVGVYSLVYWLCLRAARAFAIAESVSRIVGDVVGLALSSTLFAAAHFEPLLARLGLPGPEFNVLRFGWLVLGGVCLGILFRWRGPGVAAWTHGLFNVALWVGIDPSVIL